MLTPVYKKDLTPEQVEIYNKGYKKGYINLKAFERMPQKKQALYGPPISALIINSQITANFLHTNFEFKHIYEFSRINVHKDINSPVLVSFMRNKNIPMGNRITFFIKLSKYLEAKFYCFKNTPIFDLPFSRDVLKKLASKAPFLMSFYGAERNDIELIKIAVSQKKSLYNGDLFETFRRFNSSKNDVRKFLKIDYKGAAKMYSRGLDEYYVGLYSKILEVKPNILMRMPANRINKKLALISLKKSGGMLRFVPSKIMDDEIIEVACTKAVSAYAVVPESRQNPHLLLKCALKDKRILKYKK